jgi:hypothetical protein
LSEDLVKQLHKLTVRAHEHMAAMLRDIGQKNPSLGLDVLVHEFGVRVRVTDVGWVVMVREIVNWRILDCRNDAFTGVPTAASGWTRGWCYPTPLTAVVAALSWSGRPDTEPSGWTKSVVDGRFNGEPTPGIKQE